MRVLACLIVVAGLLAPASSLSADTKWDNLLEETALIFDEMTEMPEEGIPTDLLRGAYAIAIFPSTMEAGFIIGGQYGQGIIVARDKKGGDWGSPAVYNITGGSFGWQIGGQATDIILLIMNQRGLDGLLKSHFKLGADVAVAAGPVGRDAQASTDAQLKGGILAYSRSRGVFAGAKLEGSVVYFNEKGNESLYYDGVTADDIIRDNKVAPPASAQELLSKLSKY